MAIPLDKIVIKRVFNRVYVCKKCKSKIRADAERVRTGKIKCRRCNSRALRPKNKERKAKVTKTA